MKKKDYIPKSKTYYVNVLPDWARAKGERIVKDHYGYFRKDEELFVFLSLKCAEDFLDALGVGEYAKFVLENILDHDGKLDRYYTIKGGVFNNLLGASLFTVL